jgi:hypothetical protein
MMTINEPSGQWVDIPPQYAPPTMASPATNSNALADLAQNGTVIAILMLLFGAVAACVFLGAIRDASCGCKGNCKEK